MQIDGWMVYAHPMLLDQLDRLATAVRAASEEDPEGWRKIANAKVLASIHDLIFHRIPHDPERAEYRLGNALGAERRHWFRAKFGNGRFRLFFRYDSRARILIFAWVNDRDTLRAYGARTDAYAVFARMLKQDRPPDDWASLLAESAAASALRRLESVSAEK